MRLSLSPARGKISLIRHRHKNSLLPFWVYWPQKVVVFALVFIKNTLLSALKEHFLTILLLVGTIIFTHVPLSQAAAGHVFPAATNGAYAVITNIIEIVGIVLAAILILLRSYDTTTGRTKKNRVTYSRNIDDE